METSGAQRIEALDDLEQHALHQIVEGETVPLRDPEAERQAENRKGTRARRRKEKKAAKGR